MSAPAAAHAKSASTIRLHLARPQRGEAGRGFAVASGLLEQIRLFLKGLGAPPHGLSAAGPLPPNDTSRTSLSANRARSFSSVPRIQSRRARAPAMSVLCPEA